MCNHRQRRYVVFRIPCTLIIMGGNEGGDDMSYWTGVFGTICVSVPGLTQPHKDFIIQTVMDHLPAVTGDEGDMTVNISKIDGYDDVIPHDVDGRRRRVKMQSGYLISISASLRGRFFDRTLKEFTEWLCRLSKRLMVVDILVVVRGVDENARFVPDWERDDMPYLQYTFDNNEPYYDMYEYDYESGEGNWTDWMWPEMQWYGNRFLPKKLGDRVLDRR